ncbi:MAG: HslU--HslV peptidase ATPase subunit [Candidatus Lambdaproteobacteria bacterium RIFOXYD1_FULL_56_27]|uniref:ATP-dependent protease ATPase subunit HslU n=1 Tax=Candidatus Lambdaproteobacteria bacterium RIFOXYD2_FULL_56_26 TaxID=1817773 RepID=A0A1F6GUP3_9PROT|nr:MAG: HslU--HslV peptidase ATPase subunit [Candidatus Lambdaproteobacteria bacterium RIFOXYD2_FULL_56_26]OGH02262.1 MAG: HslU--HslV peptidase ATPase subunit [Candidatus Lambdaproteobacteria bacterium RIFOXYC1_FULL_56_13]OGH10031.1 MAG: HslU--HslV peptidase ATPase subunit [Candidatus Lambdaproteobacteria bacterium RIFOXYD1_FULL_56_27]
MKHTQERTPRETVEFLDRYIVGQKAAKKSVAIALRNRWRRMQVPEELREEISPKNIIMIGPTGVGKTEIARRIAKLEGAPFLKVEASKFTEVGYVGRDVESIIRDLAEIAVAQIKAERMEAVKEKAAAATTERLLDLLVPPQNLSPHTEGSFRDGSALRESFRHKLEKGELEDKILEIQVERPNLGASIELFPVTGNDSMDMNLKDIMSKFMPRQAKNRKATVAEARKIFSQEESERLIDQEDLGFEVITRVENTGIVFIDEIDKIASKAGSGNQGEVSREGVQRDLLPIIEGSRVNTKYGPIQTDHILFIAAGAFHVSKPSDLIPELQGRFPIRVELESLKKEDFVRILTEPQNSLVLQYVELLKTEGVQLEFAPEAVEELAELATLVNDQAENIGARRLHAILEKLLEEVSFSAPELPNQTILITAQYVKDRLADIAANRDLSRYIL